MPTVSVNLDTSQYVKVNTGFTPMVLQANNDTVRITISTAQPVKTNEVFHILGGKDAPLHLNSLDTNVWALAITEKSSLIVSQTEHESVHITGNFNAIVNELFHKHTGVTSTIAVPVDAGDISLELADATGFNIGGVVEIHDTVRETTFPIITALPGGNVITLDRPLDFGYSIGDGVDVIHTDLKTEIGTLAAPISHVITPPEGVIWNIERIILTMVHGTAGADDKFGDLLALTNGVVIRANINGQFGSFTNWKTNGDIRRDMYDVSYSDKAGGPAGFGTSGRGSFNRIGVTLRLNGDVGDYLEVLVQDDLTDLNSFLINGQGHFRSS